MKTVQVSKRGCGFPKEGGFYAIGGGTPMTCFALPVELTPCTCCMQMPKQARTPTKVTSEYLHAMFNECEKKEECKCCIMDNRTYWISWIGSDYTAKTFNQEVNRQGLSRRIPPTLRKNIQPGDLFANVKGGKIISIVPIQSVRYYVKPTDDVEKISKLEEEGVEVCKLEIVNEPETEQANLEL